MLSKDELCRRYTPEQVLLVLLSRLYFSKAVVAEVQSFIEGYEINARLFYRLLKEHQVRPFIYQVIKANGIQVDTELLSILQRDTFRTSSINIHQQNLLNQLFQDFKNQNILAIPYKGVAITSRYYPSLSMREGSDIDLFVDASSVRRVRKYFRDKHFAPKEDVPDDFMNYMLRYYRDISFRVPHPGFPDGYTLEIQWKLIDGFVGRYVDFETFSKQLENNAINKTNWPSLNVTYDFICLISNHFFKDHLNRFKYLIDIGCLLSTRGGEIDKAAVTAIVEQYRYTRFFNGAMQCMEELLGLEYDGIKKDAASRRIVMDNILAFPVKKNEKNDRVVFDLQESFFRKIILILRRLKYFVLPNYNDISAFNRSAAFLPLLFVTKPFRLWKKMKHRLLDH